MISVTTNNDFVCILFMLHKFANENFDHESKRRGRPVDIFHYDRLFILVNLNHYFTLKYLQY